MNEPSSSNHPSNEPMESLDSLDSSNVLTLEQGLVTQTESHGGYYPRSENGSWDQW